MGFPESTEMFSSGCNPVPSSFMSFPVLSSEAFGISESSGISTVMLVSGVGEDEFCVESIDGELSFRGRNNIKVTVIANAATPPIKASVRLSLKSLFNFCTS